MLKNESARNPMKPTPLHPSRLPDSGGIFTLSNGVRMEKISHSVRQAKQAKFLDADCTCPYSPYRTHVSPYSDTWQVHMMTHGQVRTGHMVAPGSDTCQADLAFLARSWTNPKVTRVTTGRVTHGTDDVSRMTWQG
jgi:hypothetical protein